MVYVLSYHSLNCLEDLTDDTRGAIEDLLKVARFRNEKLQITGALMFNEGRFAQVLEGPKQAVIDVFKSIKSDRRHSNVTVVSVGNAAQRSYGSWSMHLVGTSAKAKEYYAGVVKSRQFDWGSPNGESLNRLLLELISLDN